MAMPVTRRLTLATRAALMVGVVFVATFGTLAYRSLLYFEDHFIALAGQHQEALLREYADKLSANMAAANITLNAAAKIADQKILENPSKAQDFLQTRTFLLSSFSQGLYLVDKAGQTVAHTVGGPSGTPRDLLPAEIALAQRTLKTGVAQTSAAFATVANGHIPLIAMSAPVRSNDGAVIGVMQGSLALLDKNYAGTLASIKIGINGYLFLTTRDRIMLLHPNPERILAVTAKSGQNVGLDRALEQGFEGTTETVNSTGLHALSTFVPVPGRDWVLGANFPMAEVRDPFRRSLREMVGAAAAGVLLLFGLVTIIVRRLMRPVQQLTERLEELGKGVSRTMDLPGSAELDIMVGTFNKMLNALGASEAARLEAERSIRDLNTSLEQRVKHRTLELECANTELQATLSINASMHAKLVQSEKLAALGKMVAGIAHELNTPIGNALLVATTLRERTQQFCDRARAGILRRIDLATHETESMNSTLLVERNLGQAAELVANFKQVAVDQTAEHRRVFDLGETVQDVLATLAHLIRHRPLLLHMDLPSGITMNSYPGPVGQLVTNFFTNAITHAFTPEASGEMWVSCQSIGDDEVCLVFKDNGRGIKPEDLDRVFDPFFTTRLGVGGSGLGLSIAHGIVTGVLGGTLAADSMVGCGTAFTARFQRRAPNLEHS